MNQKNSLFEKILFLQGKDSINRIQFITRFFALLGFFVLFHFSLKVFYNFFAPAYDKYIDFIIIIIIFFLVILLFDIISKRLKDIFPNEQRRKILDNFYSFFMLLFFILIISSYIFDNKVLINIKEGVGLIFKYFSLIIIILGMVLPKDFFKKFQK